MATGGARWRRAATRLQCSSAVSNTGLRARGLRILLDIALGLRWLFIIGFLAVVVAASFRLAPFLGRNFFPPVEGAQISLHMRAQIGTRIEETGVRLRQVEDGHPGNHPARLRSIVDNIGLPISGINMAYSNSGTIGASTPIS